MAEAFLIFIDKSSSGIDTTTLEKVEKEIGDSKADHLYLVLESYGGDPFSAVAIMNILQSHFPKISAVVPRFAKSAATLMALGTDVIYMGDRSALGPLDLPIEHHRDGARISALDVQNTITTMSGLIDTIAEDRYTFLRSEDKGRRLSKKEAASIALKNATDFLKPIVGQIDPYHLQKAYRELRIGYVYATDMLMKRMAPDLKTAETTAKKLVQDFPAHEYSIFRDDARDLLKLNIEDLNGLTAWRDHVKPLYERARQTSYIIKYGTINLNNNDADDPIGKKKGGKRKANGK